jgi:ABC-2 type transport system permease protein
LLLSTATSRTRWASTHAVAAAAGTAAILLVTGAAVGIGHGAATGDPPGQAVRLLGASAAHVPAAWVMVGLVLVLFGWAPRSVPALAWGLLVAFVVLGEFGALWGLPGWVLDLSPFAHSPTLPGGNVEVGQLVLLLGAAALLGVLGMVGWRGRDLEA